ncbi:MAG TPA: LysR family transcriptional regulator [Propionibacteriaceae bacterium]|nr:LysR family transcriptional regulator [Propionibacteriaceae bacterium]
MAPPELSALALLVAVADHGGLGAAARQVGVAQPNASRSLARLERTLGLTLLVRRPQGSTLTPAGLAVAGWARTVLAAMDDLERGAAALAGAPGNGLVVAASQTVAEYLLPGWLAGLRSTGEQAQIDIRVLNSASVLDGVRSGDLGLGFVETAGTLRGLHSRIVARDELVAVVAPGHPWARRQLPVTAGELAATPLVVRERGSGTRDVLERALREKLGPDAEVVAPALELASNAAVRVATLAGTAPAVLSRLAVADAVASGLLRRVAVDLELSRWIRAVWAGPQALTGVRSELLRAATGGRPAPR